MIEATLQAGGLTHRETNKKATAGSIVAICFGNLLEFYDLTVFGFFTPIIGKLFFPSGDETVQILYAVGVFGVGYVMRPVGGVVIGRYADKYGRKAGMTLCFALMALGTAIIGFCPTVAQVGIWAPVMLVAAKLIQGFSAGGEVGSAGAMLAEYSDNNTRGFYTSWLLAGQSAAVVLGAGTGVILSSSLSTESLESWGWRIPFLLGILIGPLGIYVRKRLAETSPHESGEKHAVGLRELFGSHGGLILRGVVLVIAGTVCNYVVQLYIATYAMRTLHLPTSTALVAAFTGGVVGLISAPLCGLLSDRFGRRATIFWGRVGCIVAVVPLFQWLIGSPSIAVLMTLMLVMVPLIWLHSVSVITVIAEMFSKPLRATGVGVIYSVGVSIFGGLTQPLAVWLAKSMNTPLVPAYMVIAACAISTLGLIGMKEYAGKSID